LAQSSLWSSHRANALLSLELTGQLLKGLKYKNGGHFDSAQLRAKGGLGRAEQIHSLRGHATVQTTERYMGCRQKFGDRAIEGEIDPGTLSQRHLVLCAFDARSPSPELFPGVSPKEIVCRHRRNDWPFQQVSTSLIRYRSVPQCPPTLAAEEQTQGRNTRKNTPASGSLQ